MSLRDKILNADDISTEIIDIPAWGVEVEVRSMDGRSRTRLLKMASGEDGSIDMEIVYPEMILLCAFDPETGERIFDEGDRDALLSKAAGPIELLALAAMRVSGMSADSVDEAGKDSSTTTSEGSASS